MRAKDGPRYYCTKNQYNGGQKVVQDITVLKTNTNEGKRWSKILLY